MAGGRRPRWLTVLLLLRLMPLLVTVADGGGLGPAIVREIAGRHARA